MIRNPILKGFNPDPSIIRVGEDYYIATSTFEWFPGVQIYHSRDLENWKLIVRPLERISQLDMKGCDSSAGVFAPCLTYDAGVYYLMYTNVRTHIDEFMDCHNYLVTATDIKGPWSEPIYIHSLGFDPSLFHDEDGRKWITSVNRRYKSDDNAGFMGGVVLQEYSPELQKVVGAVYHISNGCGITTPEGPHIYKKDGWYYLLLAEGGTEFGHATTMMRAKQIKGPYEGHPNGTVITSRRNLGLVLQKSGHSDLVETSEGEWYMVHLCGRPLPPLRRCILGRETAIQKVVWKEDGWLYLQEGGDEPYETCKGIIDTQEFLKDNSRYYSFNSLEVPIDFQSLRIPLSEEHLSFKAREGYLRLIGKDSPNSRFEQSLIARRQQSFNFMAQTSLEFEPKTERQMAGLIYIYDVEHFYYLRITCNYVGEKIIEILSMDGGKASYDPKEEVKIPRDCKIYLKVEVEEVEGQFFYSLDEKEWHKVGGRIDSSKLSDDYRNGGAYTGAMIGIGCHDMKERKAYADFEYFNYQER